MFGAIPSDVLKQIHLPDKSDHLLQLSITWAAATLQEALTQVLDQLFVDRGRELRGWKVGLRRLSPVTGVLRDDRASLEMDVRVDVHRVVLSRTIQVRGDIRLRFISHYKWDEDGRFMMKTEIETYHWLDEPQLDVGLFDIPIKSLVDYLMDHNIRPFLMQFDAQAANDLSVHQWLPILSDRLTKGIAIPDSDLRLSCPTSAILCGPIQLEEDQYEQSVWLECILKIGKEPNAKKPIPRFEWNVEDHANGSFSILAHADQAQLSSWLLTALQLPESPPKQANVHITSLSIDGDSDRIHIETVAAGRINGKLSIDARLRADSASLHVHLAQSRLAFRGRSWLDQIKFRWVRRRLKQTIEKGWTRSVSEVEERLNEDLKKALSTFLRNDESIRMHVDLQDVQRLQLHFKDGALHARSAMNGRINIHFVDLSILDVKLNQKKS